MSALWAFLIFTLLQLISVNIALPTEASKPTILIVPGAWTTAPQFEPFKIVLTSLGYHTVVHTLPSVNSHNPSADTVQTDANFVRDNFLLPEVEQGCDVVVLTHSYGGLPGAIAAAGLSKVERSKNGQQGGVIGIILLASFPLPAQNTVLGALGGQPLPWFEYSPCGTKIAIKEASKAPIFFNDLPRSLSAALPVFTSLLGNQSAPTFTTSSLTPPAWSEPCNYDNRRVYIKTLRDAALPPQAQDGLIEGTGVPWNIKEIDSGHCPFMTRVKELGGLVDGIVRRFGKLGDGKGERE